ncbi:MAG: TolC family protein [Spirochaetales bacterium]|nr:TolC family protein [Spirochaetales bacterium]
MAGKSIIIITFLLISAALVHAEPDFTLNDRALTAVLVALKTDCRAYTANEAYNEGGRLQHEAAMSQYYLQLTGGLDSSGQNSFKNILTDDIVITNNYSLLGGPELSFSQLLPSYGTLSGSVSDRIRGSGIEESNSPLLPRQEALFHNDLSFSIGLSQPLYFGEAYGASLRQVDQNLDISRINYQNNRNILVISAIEDYYNLLKAKYQVDLIAVRLKTNTEYLRRMEKEYQLGIWTLGQLNSARAASLQSSADLLKAEQALISANELMSSVYGLTAAMLMDSESSASSDAESVITELNSGGIEVADLLSRLDNSPDIRISLNRIAITESEIVLKQQQSAMILNAGGTYKISSGLTEETYSDNLSLSLGLSSSIIDGGAAESAIAVKKNELLRLENELEDKRARTVSQMNLFLNNIILSRKLSDIYILQEETSRFEYDKGLKEFELGGITQKDLLDLQIELENTRLSLLLNKINYNLAVLQLYKLLGYDLEGMLLG